MNFLVRVTIPKKVNSKSDYINAMLDPGNRYIFFLSLCLYFYEMLNHIDKVPVESRIVKVANVGFLNLVQ